MLCSIWQVCFSSLTVGSHGDEGSGGEEQDEDHVTAKEKPSQRGQVVEPGGCVSVQRLVEERLEVGLTPERPDCPQTLQRDDEVGEDGASSCRRGEVTVLIIIESFQLFTYRLFHV